MLPRASPAFLSALDRHLAELGWSDAELSRKAQIGSTQIARWRNFDRGVGRAEINKIAVAIAIEWDSRDRQSQPAKSRRRRNGRRGKRASSDAPTSMQRPSIASLDAFQIELLTAAGYDWNPGPGDRVLRRLSSDDEEANPSVLRIGFPDVPPLAYHDGGQERGLSVTFARAVARMLGVTPEFVPVAWDDLLDQLVARRIDVVAPVYFRLPSREVSLRFSNSIGLLFRIAAFVNPKFLNMPKRLSRSNTTTDRPILTKNDEEMIEFCSARGGEGSRAMADIFTPSFKWHAKQFEDPRQALRHVMQNSGGVHPAFVTVAAMALRLCEELHASTGSKPVPMLLPDDPPGLPAAFAALPSETWLIDAINSAIHTLRLNHYPSFLLKIDSDAKGLRDFVQPDNPNSLQSPPTKQPI